DIQTTAFNVYPNQEYNSEGQVVRKFFSVDNTVYVKVRELDKLGQILDAVVRAGANQINGISFDVENRTEAEAQARIAAIADARMKAEELAAAAGVTLGELQTASVYNSGGAIPVYEGKGGYMSADASVPMSAGQMQVTADASLTYIIK
ncbi:MAG TPA: SIMPL domain-containing protein, partial [Anaerolineaceae bacterium]|nr:SIMPL domain-containing protein [Anaerolineaceae bacterium]